MPRAPHPSCVPHRTLSAASGLVGRGMPRRCPSHLRSRDSRWRCQEEGWTVLWGAAGRKAPTNVSPMPIPMARPCRWQLSRSAGPPGARAGAACLNRILKSRDYESRARHEARQCRHLSSPRSSRSARREHLQHQRTSPSSCCCRSLLVALRWDRGQLRGVGKDQVHRAPGLQDCSLLWLPDPIIVCSRFPPPHSHFFSFLLPPGFTVSG